MSNEFENLRQNIIAMRTLEKEHAKTPKVIEALSEKDGCPCDNREFIYWVGKHHDDRSDFIQTHLIETVVHRLKLYLKIPGETQPSVIRPEYVKYTASYICSNCDTVWELFGVEWTMLNLEYCLRRTDIGDPSNFYPNVGGNSIFLRGAKQSDMSPRQLLDFEGWRKFLLSGIC